MRPWALEEQLLAPLRTSERERRVAALGAKILEERARVARMEEEVRRRIAELGALEEELSALIGRSGGESVLARTAAEAEPPDERRETVELRQPATPDVLDYLLCRCEGFQVESRSQTVGVVEGVRFGTRLDRPDLIEVRTGTLAHRLLLIPVEDVERIDDEDERVFLRGAPADDEYVHSLRGRLRRMLAHGVRHEEDRLGDPRAAD
jgi:hypothetical protein